MNDTISLKVWETLKANLNLTDEKAKILTRDLTEFIKDEIQAAKTETATKEDIKDVRKDIEIIEIRLRGEIIKTAFWAGLFQIIIILGALTGILSFMLSHKG